MLLAVHYRVMEHLGGLESTQEARVALGYRLGQLLRFFRALQTSRVIGSTMDGGLTVSFSILLKVPLCIFSARFPLFLPLSVSILYFCLKFFIRFAYEFFDSELMILRLKLH